MKPVIAVLLLVVLTLAATLWLWPRDESVAAPVSAVEAARAPEPTAVVGSTPASAPSRESVAAEPPTLPAAAPDQLAGVVVRPDGLPVRGARIAGRGRPPADAAALTQVESDERGRFVCAGATPKAAYLLRIAAPGYVPAETGAIAGQSLRITLEPGASLSGTVTDADRKPVAAARLWLQQPLGTDPRTGRPRIEITSQVVTDRGGRYQIASIPLRDAVVWILAADAVPESRTLQVTEPREYALDIQIRRVFPLRCEVRDVTSRAPIAGAEVLGELPEPLARSDQDGQLVVRMALELPTVLRVRATGYAPIEHHLSANRRDLERTTLLLLARGARITGRVVDGEGAPIAGAQLTLEPVPLSKARTADRARQSRAALPKVSGSSVFTGGAAGDGAISGTDGGFELDGLIGKDGVLHARVRAECAGFCDAWSEPIDLDVPVREASTLVRMVRGGVIEGCLTWRGEPTPGSVQAQLGTWQASARVDASGEFVLPRLPAGTATLSAQAWDSHGAHTTREVVVPDGGHTRVAIEFATPAAVLPALTGSVRDADGQPAPGIRIRLEREGQSGGSRVFEGAVSDGEGRWRFELKPEGTGPPPAYTAAVAVGGIEQRYEHLRGPHDGVDFQVVRPAVLPIQVRCADGSKPESVRVLARAVGAGSWQPCRKEAEAPFGTQMLAPDEQLRLPPGEFDLLVATQGYRPVGPRRVQVAPSGNPTVPFVLERGVRVVLEPTGLVEALDRRRIGLVHADEPLAEGPLADGELARRGFGGARVGELHHGNGRLQAAALAPGRYRLLSEDRDLAFDPEWIEVGDQDFVGRVQITLRR